MNEHFHVYDSRRNSALSKQRLFLIILLLIVEYISTSAASTTRKSKTAQNRPISQETTEADDNIQQGKWWFPGRRGKSEKNETAVLESTTSVEPPTAQNTSPKGDDEMTIDNSKDDQTSSDGKEKESATEKPKPRFGRVRKLLEPRKEKDEKIPSSNATPATDTIPSTNATLVNESEPEVPSPTSEAQSSNTNASATINANQTTPSSTQQPPSTTTASPGGSGVIIMGASPLGYYARPYGSAGGPPMIMPSQQRGTPTTPTSHSGLIVLADVIASVLGTLSRLWFLTWLTRRIASQEESMPAQQHFVFELLNDRYVRDASALNSIMHTPPAGVSPAKWKRHVNRLYEKQRRQRRKEEKKDWRTTFSRTVIVAEISSEKGSGSSGGGLDVAYISDMITFLLLQHRNNAFGPITELEILLQVTSPGGSVVSYGLLGAHIQRLSSEPGIHVTVSVDKYAASGGYMLASQAHKLIAAPFATIGSIGVILEGVNFYDFVKKYGIQPIIVKAGASKNPLSTFGAVTKRDLEAEQQRIEKVHTAFKDLVVRGRPVLEAEMEKVGDGSVYLGQEAIHLNLIDAVMTSDEYILERICAGDRVLKLHRSSQSRFPRRVTLSPIEVLPHLKGKLGEMGLWNAETIARAIQIGNLIGFIRHMFSRYAN